VKPDHELPPDPQHRRSQVPRGSEEQRHHLGLLRLPLAEIDVRHLFALRGEHLVDLLQQLEGVFLLQRRRTRFELLGDRDPVLRKKLLRLGRRLSALSVVEPVDFPRHDSSVASGILGLSAKSPTLG
jgi:hypothetical protein